MNAATSRKEKPATGARGAIPSRVIPKREPCHSDEGGISSFRVRWCSCDKIPRALGMTLLGMAPLGMTSDAVVI